MATPTDGVMAFFFETPPSGGAILDPSDAESRGARDGVRFRRIVNGPGRPASQLPAAYPIEVAGAGSTGATRVPPAAMRPVHEVLGGAARTSLSAVPARGSTDRSAARASAPDPGSPHPARGTPSSRRAGDLSVAATPRWRGSAVCGSRTEHAGEVDAQWRKCR